MPVFQPEQVFRPTTTDSLVDLRAEDPETTLLLGGGTFIHSLVARGLLGQITRLIDLSGMDWSNIEVTEDTYQIGSTATFRDLLEDSMVRRPWAGALYDALNYPPPQITNLATVGGSIASSSTLFDVPIAFLVLGSSIRARSSNHDRILALENFFEGYFQHSLEPAEVITHLLIPRPENPAASALKKLDTNANDLAIVNVGAFVTTEPDEVTCREVRIALGGGGVSKPTFVPEAEEELQGDSLTDSVIDRVSTAVETSVDQTGDLRASSSYRQYMAKIMTRDVLKDIRSRLNGVS